MMVEGPRSHCRNCTWDPSSQQVRNTMTLLVRSSLINIQEVKLLKVQDATNSYITALSTFTLSYLLGMNRTPTPARHSCRSPTKLIGTTTRGGEGRGGEGRGGEGREGEGREGKRAGKGREGEGRGRDGKGRRRGEGGGGGGEEEGRGGGKRERERVGYASKCPLGKGKEREEFAPSPLRRGRGQLIICWCSLQIPAAKPEQAVFRRHGLPPQPSYRMQRAMS